MHKSICYSLTAARTWDIGVSQVMLGRRAWKRQKTLLIYKLSADTASHRSFQLKFFDPFRLWPLGRNSVLTSGINRKLLQECMYQLKRTWDCPLRFPTKEKCISLRTPPFPSTPTNTIKQKDTTCLRIEAVSSISAMKVDTPFSWLSPAPTRARIQSTMVISADSHGTKHPIWAMRTITPVCRMYVDFPPMLGPKEEIFQKNNFKSIIFLQFNSSFKGEQALN